MPGNVLLALASAASWGGGDFTGGMGARSAGGTVGGAVRFVLLSHLTSLAGLLVAIWAMGVPAPHETTLLLGMAAGVAGGLSITAFYIALSRGAMGVSAAVSGVLAAAIPAAVAMATEGSPGVLRLSGFLVAGMAIWMIAAGPSEGSAAGTMALAVGAGAGFGIYFVGLKLVSGEGPGWAMATARMGSLCACGVVLLAVMLRGREERGGRVPLAAARWVLLTAVLDTAGNMLFVSATRVGRLDVAAVLASLYPATTILLAAWTMKERPTRRQGWGMVVAAGAVVMITV